MSSPSKLIVTSFAGIDQSNETPSRFSIELPNSIADVNNVELLSASIEYTPLYPSLPPDNCQLNMTVYIGANPGATRTITLNQFEYYPDMTTFLAKLNAEIVGSYAPTTPFQFNFNTITQTLEIEALTANTRVIIRGEPQLSPPSQSQKLFRRLGFGLQGQTIDAYFTPEAYKVSSDGWEFDYTFVAVNDKILLPSSPNIVRSTTLYVGSSTLANDALLPRGIPITSIMAQIPLTTSEYGRVLNYTMENDQTRSTTFDNNISYITISLLDDEFNALELKQNSRISCVFGLQYKQGHVTTARIIH